jgi:CRP-like cAMP-binding protein
MRTSPSASANSPCVPEFLSAASGEVIASAFARCGLSREALAELADSAQIRLLPRGALVSGGSDDNSCFVLCVGRLTRSVTRDGLERVVGTADPGDVVGGIAAIPATPAETIVATSDVELLDLDLTALRRIAETAPALRRFFDDRAEQAMLERLVRATRIFDGATSGELRGLVRSIERRSVAAGVTIVKQGDAADEAFVIVSGSVDIINESTQQTLASLAAGALFGEAALVNETHRNATARAHDDVSLLVLRCEPFLAVVRNNESAKARMIDLLNARERPLRATGIEETRQVALDGSEIAVLKHLATNTYLRLSGDGLFLWERADGTHTIRDLATALFTERHHFAPQVVIDTMNHLRAQGFLRTSAHVGLRPGAVASTGFDRVLDTARRVLTASLHFHDVDTAFASAYRSVGRPFFTLPGALLLAVFALAGMVLFAAATPRAVAILWTPHGLVSFVVVLLPAYGLLIALHEIGHGFGVKAVGRKVETVGIGWYWFGPVAFVDTSDTWAASRAQRILVSACGLVMNLIVAAIASAFAFAFPQPIVAVAAWQFALTAYIGVIENLNPLLEFDGYYILADLLDRPNLRRQSLAWLGINIGRLFRRPELVRGHRIEFMYAVGAFCYIVFAAAQSLVLYHVIGQQRLAYVMPAPVAAAIAWILPILLAAAAFAALLGEMRRVSDATG